MTNMVEKVARALCVADGLEPDETIGGEDGDFWRIEPRWRFYQREANRFVAAFAALSPDQAEETSRG